MRYLVLISLCVLWSIQGYAMAHELQPCPAKPNCVSSLEQGKDSYIEPLSYAGDAGEAQRRLLEVIRHHPRTAILREEQDFIHATFTSLIFRFVDDVEFVFDDQRKTIHVRSA